MTDTKHHESESQSLQGRVFRPETPADLAEAIEHAFDYRGDVALCLRTGDVVHGYIFNRHLSSDPPYLEIFSEGQADPRKIHYPEIQELRFSGEDTASGKSWEMWVTKKETQRLVEASRVEAEARARGHL